MRLISNVKLISNERYNDYIKLRKKFNSELEKKLDELREIDLRSDLLRSSRFRDSLMNYKQKLRIKDIQIQTQRDRITELLEEIDRLQGINKRRKWTMKI